MSVPLRLASRTQVLIRMKRMMRILRIGASRAMIPLAADESAVIRSIRLIRMAPAFRMPTSAKREQRNLGAVYPSYIRAPTYRSRSTQRLAYPHSLSYQPETLSSNPSTTFVLFASRMQECGLPM